MTENSSDNAERGRPAASSSNLAESWATPSQTLQDGSSSAQIGALLEKGKHDPMPVSGGFQFDPFAMASLQTTAAAILAAQDRQHRDGQSYSPAVNAGLSSSASASAFSGSESETGQSRTVSPATRIPAKGEQPALRRSVSLGKSTDAAAGKAAPHHDRHMWTQEETQALVTGCNKHGVGNWKAILKDTELTDKFKGRTPGDLKDRFRTYFPDAYHDLYPNAKTHTSRAVRSKAADGTSIFEKGKTKERRPFSAAEDEVLKRGYEQHGSHWAIIAREPVFEGRRKSTDLRDRFRNAFPGIYEQAGFKPRTKSVRRERRLSGNGSFSQSERPSIPHSSRSEESTARRPDMILRRETSTSTQSQEISEVSEDEEGDFGRRLSDAQDAGSSSVSRDGRDSSLTVSQQSSIRGSRSQSFTAVTVPDIFSEHHDTSAFVEESTHVGTERNMSTAAAHHPSVPRHPLRRSHSSKRGAAKICSLEQAMKTANMKSNREAILATHHHGHHHHHHHPQHQPHHPDLQTSADMRAMDAGKPEQATLESIWTASEEQKGEIRAAQSASDLVAAMDLDQINDLMNGGEASSDSIDRRGTAQLVDQQQTLPMDGSTSAQNALLDSLFQQWSSSELISSRAGQSDTFQALLDPLGPSYLAALDQNAAATTWTPISSSAAPAISASSPSTASRREHEHNQWAGDLLHRGNFDALMFDPHAFITLLNAQQAANASSLAPNVAASGTNAEQLDFSSRPDLEHTLSVPRYDSRKAQELQTMQQTTEHTADVNNARAPFAGEYRDSFAYPADDLSLLNTYNAGDGSILNQSLGIAGPSADMSGANRRRRSTDTLRESSGISALQSWRGLGDGTLFTGVDENAIAQTGGNRPISIQSSDNSRSLSSIDPQENDDDDDIPSRAASVGNYDLSNGARDQVIYAESLPDLTSADILSDGPQTSSTSTFGQLPQLQMSFDDLDLPMSLNRSPSNAIGSPRLQVNSDSAWKSFAPRQQLGPRASMYQGSGQSALNPSFGFRQTATRESDVPSQNAGDDVSAGTTAFARIPTTVDTSSHVYQANAQSFAASRMNDAGALDRLEHLYLEGLHTPGSPMMSSFFASQQSYSTDLGSMQGSTSNTSQRPHRSSIGFGRTDTIRPFDNHGARPG